MNNLEHAIKIITEIKKLKSEYFVKALYEYIDEFHIDEIIGFSKDPVGVSQKVFSERCIYPFKTEWIHSTGQDTGYVYIYIHRNKYLKMHYSFQNQEREN